MMTQFKEAYTGPWDVQKHILYIQHSKFTFWWPSQYYDAMLSL